MFPITTLVVFAMLQWQSTNVFGISFKAINNGLEGMRRSRCLLLKRSSANVQFPWYCKPGSLSVIYVNVGLRWVNTKNKFAYNGAVQRNADVKFTTEQDGAGEILAKFNGVILKCEGFSSLKQRTCTIPRALRPWSGTITVELIGSHPSTFFRMSGTPVCPNPAFQGYNCNQDVNECEKQPCARNQGCVNTYGSYMCTTCPPGYKVWSKNARYCEPDYPKILSPSKNYTVMLFQTATLPCRYSASGPVIIKWHRNNRIIAIKRQNGVKQTVDTRLTLHDNGDLSIKNVTYGNAGKFRCVVQYVRFGDQVTHILDIESRPIMDAQFLVNGTHTKKHVHSVGDDVIIDCQVIAMPVPTVTWSYGQQKITTTARTKVILSKLPNMPPNLPGALKLLLRITGVTQADAGIYSCTSKNKHGVTTKSLEVNVTQ